MSASFDLDGALEATEFLFLQDDGDDDRDNQCSMDPIAAKKERLRQMKLNAPSITYEPHREGWFLHDSATQPQSTTSSITLSSTSTLSSTLSSTSSKSKSKCSDLKNFIQDKDEYRCLYYYYHGEYEKCLQILTETLNPTPIYLTWELECRIKMDKSFSSSSSSSMPKCSKKEILAVMEKIMAGTGKLNTNSCLSMAKAYNHLGMLEESKKMHDLANNGVSEPPPEY